jgi:hypothetical protein
MTQTLVETLTLEGLKKSLPNRKNAITQEIVDVFNHSLTEPEFQGEALLQSAITYDRVLQGCSGVSLRNYIDALRFCAYLVTVKDNYTEAYCKTFSARDFVKDRVGAKTDTVEYRELTTASSRFRRSRLVVDVLTISQVPLDMMFTGARYKAIAVLAGIMEDSKLDRDRVSAAKELLAATKGPENLQIALDVGVQESSATQNMLDQLTAIATRQKGLIESGARTAQDFGSMGIVEQEESSKPVSEQ